MGFSSLVQALMPITAFFGGKCGKFQKKVKGSNRLLLAYKCVCKDGYVQSGNDGCVAIHIPPYTKPKRKKSTTTMNTAGTTTSTSTTKSDSTTKSHSTTKSNNTTTGTTIGTTTGTTLATTTGTTTGSTTGTTTGSTTGSTTGTTTGSTTGTTTGTTTRTTTGTTTNSSTSSSSTSWWPTWLTTTEPMPNKNDDVQPRTKRYENAIWSTSEGPYYLDGTDFAIPEASTVSMPIHVMSIDAASPKTTPFSWQWHYLVAGDQ